jgi:hypothetical protein
MFMNADEGNILNLFKKLINCCFLYEVFKMWEENMRLADEDIPQPKHSLMGQGVRKNASLHEKGDCSSLKLRRMQRVSRRDGRGIGRKKQSEK